MGEVEEVGEEVVRGWRLERRYTRRGRMVKLLVEGAMVLFETPLFCPSIRKSFARERIHIFVGTVPLLCSRPLSTVFARMEELVAAAAVVAMSVDDDAEVDSALEMADDSVAAHLARGPLSGTSEADKENHQDLPEGCEHGAANPKV